MTDDELDAAVLRALRPDGLRERLRVVVGGGYTVLQVWSRLGPAVQAAIAPGGGEDPVAARRGVERLQRALVRLAERGPVRRGRATLTVPLNTKGPRDVLVDVFRAR